MSTTVTVHRTAAPTPAPYDAPRDNCCTNDEKCVRTHWCWFIPVTVVVIILLSTLLPSIHTIGYNEYGFRRHVYGSVDTTRIYTGERSFELLWYSFVTFPSTFQLVEGTVPVFADNGLEFNLLINYMYRLPRDHLATIYNKYGTGYAAVLESVATTAIKNAATQFTIEHYLLNRTLVESTFAQQVSQRVASEVTLIEVPIKFFKLVDISFPSALLSSASQSVIAAQTAQVQAKRAAISVYVAETTSLVAQVNANRALVVARSVNEATQINARAENLAANMAATAQGEGLAAFFQAVNFTDDPVASQLECVKLFAISHNAYNATLLFMGSSSSSSSSAPSSSSSVNVVLHKKDGLW